jgi:hypothetical protein
MKATIAKIEILKSSLELNRGFFFLMTRNVGETRMLGGIMRDLILHDENMQHFILPGICAEIILLPFLFNKESACLEEVVKKTWGKMWGRLCGELEKKG